MHKPSGGISKIFIEKPTGPKSHKKL
jgi:hypothetical protein